MTDNILSFGPYRLIPARRLLLRDGETVDVGSRALDVLIALVNSAGNVIGQRELLKHAWPNVVVNEGSLRVTIASLRKELGDGHDGARYIVNVVGQGYCFVGPVTESIAAPAETAMLDAPNTVPKAAHPRLLPRLVRLIGRNGAVEELSTLLQARRFVSVVGPGGMGKTSLAVSVGHALLDDFRDAVYFVDLSAVVDPQMVPKVVASALGVFFQAEDPLPNLIAFLGDRRALLIVDNCEHVIEAAAWLTERVHNEAPQTYILTTSREALRSEGEQIYLLAPLDYPCPIEELTAAKALESSSVQLFMDRAFAAGHTAALTNDDASLVADICRRLDGIAFAIELAASQVGVYGIRGTADLLSNRFNLLWRGRRSAPARHQTLAAMLDWSFNLLCERDRRVLTRLSIFMGVFTLDAAQSVVSGNDLTPMEVAEAIASLIDKSLILVVANSGVSQYRLLDSTFAYAAEKLHHAADANAIARNHALYFEQWLLTVSSKKIRMAGPFIAYICIMRAALAPHMPNIRAALQWCFGAAGDKEIGARLAAAAAPGLFFLPLLIECRSWCEQGLAALPDKGEDATRLTLQSFRAASSMFSQGNGTDVRRSIEDALSLAESLGDQWYRMHLLVGLSVFLSREGDFIGSLAAAERAIPVVDALGSPAAKATGESLLGVAYHLVGDQRRALHHCERSLVQIESAPGEQVLFFGYDHEIRTLIALARCYWLIGFPDRAAKTAQRVIDVAAERDHPLSSCMTLIFTATVYLWRGDFDEAEQLLKRLIAHAAQHSIGPYRTAGLALNSVLAIARGKPVEGTRGLRCALERLQAEKYDVIGPALHAALANGLLMTGEIEAAAAAVEAGRFRGCRTGIQPLLARGTNSVVSEPRAPLIDATCRPLGDTRANARSRGPSGRRARAIQRRIRYRRPSAGRSTPRFASREDNLPRV
jgi:predicted ATPase/DNA-binding winged helix-turn-helix (wHTH) protein